MFAVLKMDRWKWTDMLGAVANQFDELNVRTKCGGGDVAKGGPVLCVGREVVSLSLSGLSLRMKIMVIMYEFI